MHRQTETERGVRDRKKDRQRNKQRGLYKQRQREEVGIERETDRDLSLIHI